MDNYTRTESPIHKEFVRKHHLKIYKNGYIFTKETELPYCPKCNRFLPDRFVEGRCPYCDYEEARGDQCDRCGRLLDPTKLVDPRCTICGAKPVIRRVKHWYFDMPRFTDHLLEYIKSNKQLPANARNFSLKLLEEGLKPRPITRDTRWGIQAPFEGAEDKTIYGWFENVLGYVSATIEYFKRRGETERWREFWFDKEAKTLFFIGKDNIPFHTLILPALLLATHEGYNLPWNVVTNEFLIFQGQKFSKSRRVGVWIDEALRLYPADYWRYTLLSIRPETKDTNFTWKIFIEKVNSDLNDTLGNFIHRTFKFINNYFGSVVPEPEGLDELDEAALNSVREKVDAVARNLEAFHIQAATREFLEISHIGNRYLNEKKPWKTIKEAPQEAANTLYVAIQIVKALAVTMHPFIPFTAENLWSLLNLPDSDYKGRWAEAKKPIPPGHKIKRAEPLFQKVEASEEALQRRLEEVRSTSAPLTTTISIEDFSKVDIRIGRIVEAERVPNSKNLLRLMIDLGDVGLKQAVAGIAKHYKPEDLEGMLVAAVTNLAPRTIVGLKSEVMLLAAQNGKTIALIQPERSIEPGSRIT
ncbi:MAG: methionyl-tRNA synthetase [Candidatus Bathyarchaeota archaeon B26-2]|nr:MAG: methionyl-tRNA synthetase [Candidatus Bathyarchaeota archaeon B26-2]